MDTASIEKLTIEKLTITSTQFWVNSIKTNQPDAYLKKDFKSIESYNKHIQKSSNGRFRTLTERFFNTCDIVKDEYLTGCSSIMLMTNRRIIIFQGESFISVPLNSIAFYGTKGDLAVIQYYDDSKLCTYRLDNKNGMYIDWVNRNIVQHKDDTDLKNKEIKKLIFNIDDGGRSVDYPLFIQPATRYKLDYKALIIALLVGGLLYWDYSYKTKKDKELSDTAVSRQLESEANTEISSRPVNFSDKETVGSYLTSKTFRNSNDNMSIKFYPEGNYELKKDYEVVLTGKWVVERVGMDNALIKLDSSEGGIIMTLSSDGELTDTSSLKIFK